RATVQRETSLSQLRKFMKWTELLVSAIVLAGVAGCTPQAENSAENAKVKIEQGAEQAKIAGNNALTTGKVRSAISTANDVVITDLDVDTSDGVVTLQGKAKDEKSRSTAEEIAKNQVGSEFKVVNKITVG
ncbi:MAG TPA: BON domain-containing protein, partial [Terriglobia bacterium]|nr:BON domain-containing protein [Terriglobia bacterium]